MSYIMNTEKAIEIFRKVAIPLREEFGDKISIRLGDMSFNASKRREGHYISVSVIGRKTSNLNMSFDETTEEYISKVRKRLNEIVWIQIDKVCIDMIGKTLYLDKEKEVVVESITRDGVVCDNGDTVDASRLYIKG